MIPRPIGNASSETRLHFAAPNQYVLDISSDPHAKEVCCFDRYSNARASYLSGQDIYDHAILTTTGYTWRSKEDGCSRICHCAERPLPYHCKLPEITVVDYYAVDYYSRGVVAAWL